MQWFNRDRFKCGHAGTSGRDQALDILDKRRKSVDRFPPLAVMIASFWIDNHRVASIIRMLSGGIAKERVVRIVFRHSLAQFF